MVPNHSCAIYPRARILVLAKRIIPTVLCRGRTMVKGIAFDSWRSIGLAAQAVRTHSMRGVDELVLLDISATAEGRGPDLKLVEMLAETCFMPLAVGGGIRSLADVRALLGAGADKVVVGHGALVDPHLVRNIADAVGCQAVVVAVDYRLPPVARNPWSYIEKRRLTHGLNRWCHLQQRRGAGEILLTCVDLEGRMSGFDVDAVEMVSARLDIPVIANGGCGTYEHMAEALRAGASAVAAGAMFAFTDNTPAGAAEYLAGQGMEVRR